MGLLWAKSYLALEGLCCFLINNYSLLGKNIEKLLFCPTQDSLSLDDNNNNNQDKSKASQDTSQDCSQVRVAIIIITTTTLIFTCFSSTIGAAIGTVSADIGDGFRILSCRTFSNGILSEIRLKIKKKKNTR